MYKILVADDEPIERAVVKKTITKNMEGQIEIVLAENGREAVELYKKEGCDIALLDIAMPGVNGLEAAEQIRSFDPRGIIIFLTAFDEFDYAKKAISVQALDYLLKPAAENELITVIEEAMRILDLRVQRVKRPAVEVENDADLTQARLAAIKKQILAYLEEHYMEDIALTDVAEAMHYSESYFCKVFKTCFNKSFIFYLTELRIQKAKELLEDITVNIKDISVRSGYRDSNYFTKVFKRMEGMTPSEYRLLKIDNK